MGWDINLQLQSLLCYHEIIGTLVNSKLFLILTDQYYLVTESKCLAVELIRVPFMLLRTLLWFEYINLMQK